MDKKHIEKNIIDLKYHFEGQKINAIFIISTVGILAFIGTFIWYKERLLFGLSISLMVVLISFRIYFKTKKRMQSLLDDMRNLT